MSIRKQSANLLEQPALYPHSYKLSKQSVGQDTTSCPAYDKDKGKEPKV
jgi:hypothetical protein